MNKEPQWAGDPDESAAPANEDLGDSGLTGSVQVVAGLEPVAWHYALVLDEEEINVKCSIVNWNTNHHPFGRAGIDYNDHAKVIKTPLYSAATVEQLVRERDGWIDSAREFSTGMEYYRDQLDACARNIGLPCFTADDGGVHEEPLRAKVAEEVERLVQERDYFKGRAESWERDAQNLRNIGSPVIEGTIQHMAMELAAMTQERDKCIKECNEFWGKRSDQDFELICALQASEQQLREALEETKEYQQGVMQEAIVSKTLALPKNDTALRQWGAKLLREMAPQCVDADYLRRKADELEGKK